MKFIALAPFLFFRQVKPMQWLIGILLGILSVPFFNWAASSARSYWYTVNPVSVLNGTVLEESADEVQVHLRVQRRAAPECVYLAMRARTVDAEGEEETAQMNRISAPEYGDTLPAGHHDLGVWEIKPRSDGVSLRLRVLYECSGQLISSPVLSLPLKSRPDPSFLHPRPMLYLSPRVLTSVG